MKNEFQKINKGIHQLKGRIDDIERKQTDYEEALTFCGDEIKEIKMHSKSLDLYGKEIEAIKKSITDLKTTQSESWRSSDSFTKLSSSVKSMEQDKSNKTLILKGIPHTNKENLCKIVETLAQKLEVHCKSSDIDGVFRLKSSNDSSKAPPIIVKLNSMSTRDKFYDGRKMMARNSISTRTLGFETDDKIYINEQLSKSTQDLFYKARCKKRDLGYKYAWTFHGNIFMRKSKESDSLKNVSDGDLVDLS